MSEQIFLIRFSFKHEFQEDAGTLLGNAACVNGVKEMKRTRNNSKVERLDEGQRATEQPKIIPLEFHRPEFQRQNRAECELVKIPQTLHQVELILLVFLSKMAPRRAALVLRSLGMCVFFGLELPSIRTNPDCSALSGLLSASLEPPLPSTQDSHSL